MGLGPIGSMDPQNRLPKGHPITVTVLTQETAHQKQKVQIGKMYAWEPATAEVPRVPLTGEIEPENDVEEVQGTNDSGS